MITISANSTNPYSSWVDSPTDNGPFLTMIVSTSYSTSAAALQNSQYLSSTSSSWKNLHRRQLRISIISRSDLNDIRTNKVQPIKATDNRPQLARGPTASLWRASSRCNYSIYLATEPTWHPLPRLTSRIQSIDINGKINRIISSNTVANLLDNTIRP
jgi:hypothetical protein